MTTELRVGFYKNKEKRLSVGFCFFQGDSISVSQSVSIRLVRVDRHPNFSFCFHVLSWFLGRGRTESTRPHEIRELLWRQGFRTGLGIDAEITEYGRGLPG